MVLTLDGFLADDEHSLAWLFKHDIDENGPGSTAAFGSPGHGLVHVYVGARARP